MLVFWFILALLIAWSFDASANTILVICAIYATLGVCALSSWLKVIADRLLLLRR